MGKEKIIVANLKYDYCKIRIREHLSAFEGVKGIEVCIDSDFVEIEHEGKTSRQTFIDKLASMGYPEPSEENGLLTQAKNHISCIDCANAECEHFCFYPKI